MKTKMLDREKLKKSAINFSLSPADKKQIEEDAQKHGLSVSAYIRFKLLYEARNNGTE